MSSNDSSKTAESIPTQAQKTLFVSVEPGQAPDLIVVNGLDYLPAFVPSQTDKAEIAAKIEGFAMDPLESAINNIAGMIADDRERLHELGLPGEQKLSDVLGAHLERLLSMQLQALTPVVKVHQQPNNAVIDAFVNDIHGTARRGA